jgi:hypothetical protein
VLPDKTEHLTIIASAFKMKSHLESNAKTKKNRKKDAMVFE